MCVNDLFQSSAFAFHTLQDGISCRHETLAGITVDIAFFSCQEQASL